MQGKSSETFAKTFHEIQELRFILKNFTINFEVQLNMNLDQFLDFPFPIL